MTLKKIPRMGEGKELLTASIAKEIKTATITGNIEYKKTKFSKSDDDLKLFIDIKAKDGREYTWIANKTTSNYLIDTLGEDESKWVGQTLTFEVVKMGTQEGIRDVIYVEGAI